MNGKATCSVTVQAQKVAVTGVSLNKTSLSMTEGETQTLTATVSPSNATNKNVTWSSSNTSVATVSSSGVVTAKSAIPDLLAFTKTPSGEFRRVVLFGADRVGSLILQTREARRAASPWRKMLGLVPRTPEREIVVVDMDAARCREIVEKFPDVRVLCGDVTDESLLNEEDIFSSDLLVASSGNHELNLVTAAYMKSRGVKKVIALTANSSYGDIARKLGVDVAVPMRGSVVDAIMGHLRGRHVSSVHSVCNRRFEIVEGEIPEKSGVTGLSLRELAERDPGSALVLLHRPPDEDVWGVARGATVLGPGSRVVLITRSGDTKSVAKFFGRE